LVNNKIAKEVWVSPCAKRPDKVFVLSDEERYTLLQELFKDIAEVKVLNIEIEHGAMIPTY
jgi:phosphopantetheine adenylyltransferase